MSERDRLYQRLVKKKHANMMLLTLSYLSFEITQKELLYEKSQGVVLTDIHMKTISFKKWREKFVKQKLY